MAQINLNISKRIFNEAYFPSLKDYSTRYEVYFGGAGSGKSHFVFQKVIIKALMQKRKVLVIRKVARTLKDSVFQMALDTLSKFQLLSMCKINKTTFTIELPNKSLILFKGLDDSEKIKSITGITDIVIEEATEITQDDFTQLDLRLRAKVDYLQMFLMFNPVSKQNWCYKYFFEHGAPANTKILKTTYKDNRFLPKEYIDSLERMKITNPTYFRIYALGEFASLDKLVFNNWKVEEFNHADIKGQLLVGLDFGFTNDISAIVASIMVESEKRIYVFKTYGDTNKTNDDLANIITELGFSKSIIIADSAEPKSIEEIKRLGITKIKACKKGQDSIIHGIQQLQNYELIIHPSCTGLITELENYSWQKDKNGDYINKPIDSFNHYIDALRYSLQCAGAKLKTLSKDLF